jgi:hypothetical protein
MASAFGPGISSLFPLILIPIPFSI